MFPTNNVITDQKMYSYDFAQFLGTKFRNLNLNHNQQEFRLLSQYNPSLCNHHETDKMLYKPRMPINLVAIIYDNKSASMTIYVAGELDNTSTKLFSDACAEWVENLPPSLSIQCDWLYRIMPFRYCTRPWIINIGWHNAVVLQDDLMYILYKNIDEEVFGYSTNAICHQSVLSALATNCVEPEDAFQLLANPTNFFEYQTALYCCENASYISKQPISNIIDMFNKDFFNQSIRRVIMFDEQKSEWRFGTWGSNMQDIEKMWPEAYVISSPNYLLSSAVDFADCPASKQKQALISKEGKSAIKYQLRSDLSHILECAELAHGELLINDFDVLYEMGGDDHPRNHLSINFLCDWWNNNAPVEMRCASNFLIYIYDPYYNHLISFINENQPIIPVESIIDCKSLALFGDNIIVVFLQDLDSSKDGNCYDVAGDIYHFAYTDKYYETIDTFECLDNLRDLYLDSNNNEGAWDE